MFILTIILYGIAFIFIVELIQIFGRLTVHNIERRKADNAFFDRLEKQTDYRMQAVEESEKRSEAYRNECR